MASRAPANTRRATRRGNDENAAPAPTLRNKASSSALGPPQKVTHTNNAGNKKPAAAASAGIPGKPAAGAVGTKRTALGGVVNAVKDELVDDGAKKPAGKTEAAARRPLSSRLDTANPVGRPIAPVPHRASARPATFPTTLEAEDEMDIDRSTVVGSKSNQVKLEVDTEVDEAEEDEEDEEEGDEEEESEVNDDWTVLSPRSMADAEQTLQAVREEFHDEVDQFDTTMVAEYADDIFAHMEQLELEVMPNPNYMEHQTEIEWTMRTTLIDWLLQVHLRYHMLPETLWIAVNLVDRFLSVRVVSLIKLQLVGVTAMFIAAKYEEILAPSVDEFVYMTENGYSKDEILKGERIIMQTLDFTVSSYCSPYSWVRKISKADDYDIQTRTLSKFLMEVTLLDHRFIRCKPSMVAAIGMYLSRKMLNGDWNEAFMFYSNYTEAQLIPGAQLLCDRLVEEDFESVYVYKKYANKKFLRASTFARDWALTNSASAW